MDCFYSGSSKQRRDQLKEEVKNLGKVLPFNYGKPSQLHTLKAACVYLNKNKHFSNIVSQKNCNKITNAVLNNLLNQDKNFLSENLFGFIVCFSKKGELIYISDNVKDYIGFKSMEIILNYDYIHEIAHDKDKIIYDNLQNNYQNLTGPKYFVFYSSWFVSKIKRRKTRFSEYKLLKIKCHFDVKTNMFVAICKPVLTIANRDILDEYDPLSFHSSHKPDLKFSSISPNGQSLLGYDKKIKLNEPMNLYDILCPNSLEIISQRHINILNTKNVKGYIDPVRLIHKNGLYLDCLVNIYYENGSIMCKYQLINDAESYKEYLSNFVNEDSNFSSTENSPNTGCESLFDDDVSSVSQDEFDDFDEVPSRKCISSKNNKSREKRKMEFAEADFNERSVVELKHAKFDNGFSPSQVEFVEYEEQVQINLIKRKLEEEIYGNNVNNFRNQTNYQSSKSMQSPTNNFHSYLNYEMNNSPLDYDNQNLNELNIQSLVKNMDKLKNNLQNDHNIQSFGKEQAINDENLMLDLNYFLEALNDPDFKDYLENNEIRV